MGVGLADSFRCRPRRVCWNRRGSNASHWNCPTPSSSPTPSGHLVWGNPAAERLFEVSTPDIVGVNALDLLHPEDQELALSSLESVQGKDIGTPIELRVRVGGGWKLVELIGANRVGKAPLDGLIWCIRDITDRRRWEMLTDDTERFRSLVHNSATILMLLDETFRVESVSAALTRMLGHDQGLVEGAPLEELALYSDRPALRAALKASVDSEDNSAGPTVVEVALRRHDGGIPVPCELNIVNLLGDPTVKGLVVSAHNITQLRSTRDALERLATRDALTGLPNRTLILDRIEQMQRRGRDGTAPGAVLFVDLDRFKDVNDSLGHSVGDEVLREVAVRLRQTLRQSDSVGRLGGDEFVVLVEASADVAEATAERLLEALSRPFDVHNVARPKVPMSASIGIVAGEYGSAEELLMDADVALYEAKARGGNRAMRFEPQMRGTFRTRIELERDLRLALDRREFFLLYQPVVRLSDGTVQSTEALLRWRRPSGRVVPPDAFIPALEDSGLIVDVGAFVLDEACRQVRQWQELGLDTAVSVNVSPLQFETEGFVDTVRRASARHRARGAVPHLGDDRDHPHARLRRRQPPAQRPQAAGRPARHRRLRHRVFIPRLPAAIPHRHHQDRSRLHRRHGRRRAEHRLGPRLGGAGQRPGPRDRGRGHRDHRAAHPPPARGVSGRAGILLRHPPRAGRSPGVHHRQPGWDLRPARGLQLLTAPTSAR